MGVYSTVCDIFPYNYLPIHIYHTGWCMIFARNQTLNCQLATLRFLFHLKYYTAELGGVGRFKSLDHGKMIMASQHLMMYCSTSLYLFFSPVALQPIISNSQSKTL